ncbi:MAG: hypothetical protein F7C35_02870 [Desulfurococcales archaeon]|nr:hypothetical protein [Desulfurococcales archaeon]
MTPVGEAYLLTLSAPIKPGAAHRLVATPEFEIRLVEYLAVEGYLHRAYENGSKLARGTIDGSKLGLGKLIGEALRSAFEKTEVRPITGLIAGLIPVSAAFGYYVQHESITPEEALRRIMISGLYNSPPQETLALVEGLEAVSDSPLLLHLEDKGFTKNRILLNKIGLGELYEVLVEKDTGFLLNYKGLSLIRELEATIRKGQNTLHGIVLAYVHLLKKIANVRVDAAKLTVKELARLDNTLRGKSDYNRLLGGVAIALALILFSEPLHLPQP